MNLSHTYIHTRNKGKREKREEEEWREKRGVQSEVEYKEMEEGEIHCVYATHHPTTLVDSMARPGDTTSMRMRYECQKKQR